MNSPWIEAYPEYPKRRQSEHLLSISHLIILFPKKAVKQFELKTLIDMERECVYERTIAVEEKGVNGVDEVCGILRSKALGILLNRRLGNLSGHRRRRDGKKRGNPAGDCFLSTNVSVRASELCTSLLFFFFFFFFYFLFFIFISRPQSQCTRCD